MNIWIPIEYKSSYSELPINGLELCFADVEIDEELRRQYIKLCRWLRRNYWFPIKCKIVFEYYTCYMDSENKSDRAIAIFYPPVDDKNGYMMAYPRIKIAVADFEKDKNSYGLDDALEYYCNILIHELTHYYQWYFYETEQRSKRSLEIEANKYADAIVYIWQKNNKRKN